MNISQSLRMKTVELVLFLNLDRIDLWRHFFTGVLLQIHSRISSVHLLRSDLLACNTWWIRQRAFLGERWEVRTSRKLPRSEWNEIIDSTWWRARLEWLEPQCAMVVCLTSCAAKSHFSSLKSANIFFVLLDVCWTHRRVAHITIKVDTGRQLFRLNTHQRGHFQWCSQALGALSLGVCVSLSK